MDTSGRRMRKILNNPKLLKLYIEYGIANKEEKDQYRFYKNKKGYLMIEYFEDKKIEDI